MCVKYKIYIKIILTRYNFYSKIFIVKEVNMKSKKICIQLEEELINQLKKEAKEKHLTLSSYIRTILWDRG
jgi:predicted DNA binding CopG/RHH family protein